MGHKPNNKTSNHNQQTYHLVVDRKLKKYKPPKINKPKRLPHKRYIVLYVNRLWNRKNNGIQIWKWRDQTTQLSKNKKKNQKKERKKKKGKGGGEGGKGEGVFWAYILIPFKKVDRCFLRRFFWYVVSCRPFAPLVRLIFGPHTKWMNKTNNTKSHTTSYYKRRKNYYKIYNISVKCAKISFNFF